MRPYQLAKMISRYMIINEIGRILMAMPSVSSVCGGNAVNKRLRRGIMDIWHTTGSGKSIDFF